MTRQEMWQAVRNVLDWYLDETPSDVMMPLSLFAGLQDVLNTLEEDPVGSDV